MSRGAINTQVIPNLELSALKPGAVVRILPCGMFRSYDGRPDGVPGWRLDSGNAAALITPKQYGSTDYMIDYEHQSLSANQSGKPAPAAGWFKRLEWREGDGLYMADITWTKAARAMIAASEYRHISPVFCFDGKTGAVTRIISVALTNTPALTGLTDLAAARAVLTRHVSPEPSMTSDERHNFERVFGFDPMPGKPKLPGYDPVGVCRVGVPIKADMVSMSADDRYKYERVFGPIFAAIGQPLPK